MYQCRCCGAEINGPRQCDSCGAGDPLQIEFQFDLVKAEYDFCKSLHDLGLLESNWVNRVDRL
jgi:hypothetical protein